jgi:subtilisin family serine protease
MWPLLMVAPLVVVPRIRWRYLALMGHVGYFSTPMAHPSLPAIFLSTGGTVRRKLDLAAADCVATATPGFDPFCGTSAVAPHAAAIAGLVLSAQPTLTPAQVRQVLTATALDIEAPGWGCDSGFW